MTDLAKFAGTKIKSLRSAKKWTQEELGEKLGVGKTAIGNYERGERSPGQDMLFQLAETFDVSIDFFFPLTKKDPGINEIQLRLIKPRQEKVKRYAKTQLFEQEHNLPIDSHDFKKEEKVIHIYGQTAAGEPEEYVDGFVDEEVATVPKGADRASRIKGNSMEPLLKDGQIVFYKEQESLEIGQIGIFEIKGTAVTCKKYYIDFENKKNILQSLNTDYDDMIFEESEVRVLGLVKC